MLVLVGLQVMQKWQLEKWLLVKVVGISLMSNIKLRVLVTKLRFGRWEQRKSEMKSELKAKCYIKADKQLSNGTTTTTTLLMTTSGHLCDCLTIKTGKHTLEWRTTDSQTEIELAVMSMRATITSDAICTTDGHNVRVLYQNAEKQTTE